MYAVALAEAAVVPDRPRAGVGGREGLLDRDPRVVHPGGHRRRCASRATRASSPTMDPRRAAVRGRRTSWSRPRSTASALRRREDGGDARARHARSPWTAPFFALSNNLGSQVLGIEYYRLVRGTRPSATRRPRDRPVRRRRLIAPSSRSGTVRDTWTVTGYAGRVTGPGRGWVTRTFGAGWRVRRPTGWSPEALVLAPDPRNRPARSEAPARRTGGRPSARMLGDAGSAQAFRGRGRRRRSREERLRRSRLTPAGARAVRPAGLPLVPHLDGGAFDILGLPSRRRPAGAHRRRCSSAP